MIKRSDLSMNGTCYHKIDVAATLNELKIIFGEPELGFDKSFYNFSCELVSVSDGEFKKEPFTLYDYKEVFPPAADDIHFWHIGANEKGIATKVKEEVEREVAEIRNRAKKEKSKVWVYFTTYGSHKHDVLCIQEGEQAGDTRRTHVMLDPHKPDFGNTFFLKISPYLSEAYEVVFIDNPCK